MRVPRLSTEEAKRAAADIGIPEYMGDLSVFQMLLNHPPVARALNDLLALLIFKGRLDGRLRELVIMRIGWVTGSVYEWTQHWRVATGMDIDPDDIVAVRDWQKHEGFGEAERAVLQATDETLRDGTISADTWEACERHVGGTVELIELVVAIGNWRMFSALLRSLEVPLEDGVEAWPPDGLRPTP